MIDYERQAITSTARLPRHPGPHARPAACEHCHKTIGVVDGSFFFMRHKGREGTFHLPAEVRCDACGHRTLLHERAA
jgi:hypothetical protein